MKSITKFLIVSALAATTLPLMAADCLNQAEECNPANGNADCVNNPINNVCVDSGDGVTGTCEAASEGEGEGEEGEGEGEGEGLSLIHI